jgi:hypothetical protein
VKLKRSTVALYSTNNNVKDRLFDRSFPSIVRSNNQHFKHEKLRAEFTLLRVLQDQHIAELEVDTDILAVLLGVLHDVFEVADCCIRFIIWISSMSSPDVSTSVMMSMSLPGARSSSVGRRGGVAAPFSIVRLR